MRSLTLQFLLKPSVKRALYIYMHSFNMYSDLDVNLSILILFIINVPEKIMVIIICFILRYTLHSVDYDPLKVVSRGIQLDRPFHKGVLSTSCLQLSTNICWL